VERRVVWIPAPVPDPDPPAKVLYGGQVRDSPEWRALGPLGHSGKSRNP